MNRLEIDLGRRRYPVMIGAGLLGASEALETWLPSGQMLVVSNETVAPLYLQRLIDTLPGRHLETLVLPDGEVHKNVASWQQIIDRLVELKAGRDSGLLALGGGVIGDLTGFAAASYMRGIDFVQVPTTLLSQVDASVGGKTGINHSAGKNLIGAFHQPRGVLIDTDTLKTLPEREYRAGLAEVIKYGLIMDVGFLQWIESNLDSLLALEPEATAEAIERCCRCKASVVAADEREQGMRALLNLGHSFGHAIEALTGYSRYLHGEAVAIGCVVAARLSVDCGMLPTEASARLVRLLQGCGLPTAIPRDLSSVQVLDKMRLDKKNRSARITLVLLDALGDACTRDDIPENAILQAIEQSTQNQE
jgi:3-dehydroquinate synthase